MRLVQELRTVISAYLHGDETLDELEDWLASHVQAVADEVDNEAQELGDEAWILVDEYRRRLLTLEGLREGLADLATIHRRAPAQH